MAIRNTKLNGTDLTDGEALIPTDVNDTFDACYNTLGNLKISTGSDSSVESTNSGTYVTLKTLTLPSLTDASILSIKIGWQFYDDGAGQSYTRYVISSSGDGTIAVDGADQDTSSGSYQTKTLYYNPTSQHAISQLVVQLQAKQTGSTACYVRNFTVEVVYLDKPITGTTMTAS